MGIRAVVDYLLIYELPYKLLQQGPKNKPTQSNTIHARRYEILVILIPDAVIKPGTMVIHFKTTLPTNRAMMAAFWFWCYANSTIPITLHWENVR